MQHDTHTYVTPDTPPLWRSKAFLAPALGSLIMAGGVLYACLALYPLIPEPLPASSPASFLVAEAGNNSDRGYGASRDSVRGGTPSPGSERENRNREGRQKYGGFAGSHCNSGVCTYSSRGRGHQGGRTYGGVGGSWNNNDRDN